MLTAPREVSSTVNLFSNFQHCAKTDIISKSDIKLPALFVTLMQAQTLVPVVM